MVAVTSGATGEIFGDDTGFGVLACGTLAVDWLRDTCGGDSDNCDTAGLIGSRGFTSLGKPLIVFSRLQGRSMNMVIRVEIAGSINWNVTGSSNFAWGLCVMLSSNASGIDACDQRESLVLG